MAILRKSAAEYVGTLEKIREVLAELPEIPMSSLRPETTVLLITDMIEGFTRSGALASERNAALIDPIANFAAVCEAAGIAQIAFADCHGENSPEFASFPSHCVKGTDETLVVREIPATYTRIEKNSTNAAIEPEFLNWLAEHPLVDTFIAVGDCTDICILQLALTLKADHNRRDKPSRVIVPMDLVDTYSLGDHDGDILNLFSLYNMITNSVEVVKSITV